MRNGVNSVRVAVATALALASAYAISPAFAQEEVEEPAAEQGAGVGLQVEEIVVTAERREETVQRTSLALSVLRADQLKTGGVTQANDLAALVPGLTISNAGGIVQTYLRGVGSFATDARAEPSIAYNINGVYIARPAGIGSVFFDLDRVEVLKGPQGTLYGRNASGGAINIVTNKPKYEFAASALIEGGNFSDINGQGFVNVPVANNLAFRFAGQKSERDGYLTDGYDDEDTEGARLMGLWEPTDKLSLLFTGEYTSVGGQGSATVPRSTLNPTANDTIDPWIGPSDPRNRQTPTAAIPGVGTRILNDGNTDIDITAASLEMSWNLGFATLTAIPGYRDSDIAYLTYTPGFRFNTAETSEETSFEMRLGNASSQLKWVAGLYYFDEDQTEAYLLNASPIQNSQVNTTLTTESYAAFGQATYSITNMFRVIGGVRYTDEDKTQDGISNQLNPAGAVIATTGNLGQVDFSNVSWKTGFEYDLAQESMAFLTVSTGFKAGGLVPSIPQSSGNNTYNEEEITAYTLGSRNRFLNNRLQVNVETFYWDYEDKQERFLGLTSIGTTGLLTVNAGQATLYGVNLDVDFKLTENDAFHFGIEYLNSEYDTFNYTLLNANDPAQADGSRLGLSANATTCIVSQPAVPVTPPPPGAPNATQQNVNCAGQDLIRAPEVAGSLGYARTFRVGSNWQVVSALNLPFSSSQFLSPDFIASGADDGYVAVNADLTLRSRNGRYAFSLYGRNLSDEAIYTGGGRYAFSSNERQTVIPPGAGDPSLFYANIAPPRTYGARFEVRF